VKAVITLVHGTWARRSRWTKEGSRLRQKLGESIAGPKLFLEFPWSGNNSPKARAAAALSLCEYLRRQIALHSEAQQFVIGHSHGGTVALKAVEIGNLFDQVHVACLSTPFFYVKPRFQKVRDSAKQVALAAVTALLLLPTVLRFTIITDHWPMIVLGGILYLYAAWRVEKVWKIAAENFRLQLAISIPQSASLMIIRTVGDEASAAIAAFQIVTWVMTKIGLLYVSALGWIVETFLRIKNYFKKYEDKFVEKFKWWVLGAVVLAFVVDEFLVIAYKQHAFSEMLDRIVKLLNPINIYFSTSKWWQQLSAWEPRGGPLLAVAIASPVFILALGVIAGNVLPIGMGAVLGALVYEVTVEPVPPGAWKLHQIEPGGEIAGIMHSSVYESDRSLDALSEWINSKLTVHAPADKLR
jgi:alpha/beta hydrolase family protein